ncbi:MAG: glycosyltransferase family 4 protein [Candidatus Paceibacterota bacterium]|jgi:glycosyltransferase involved in cell wall biosynthesis
MKKKILYVITKSNWGGAQRYVYDLATNLPKDKFETLVALGAPVPEKSEFLTTGQGNGELKTKLESAGIKTISVPRLERDINIFREFVVFWQLLKIFKQEKPDVVHLNSSKIGALGSLAARLNNFLIRFLHLLNPKRLPAKILHEQNLGGRALNPSRIIFTAHGWAFKEQRNFFAQKTIEFISWFTVLFSDAVICVSKDDYEKISVFPFAKKKIRMVYNGINTVDFKPKEEARKIIAGENNIDQDSIWLGTIAELHKNKGLEYAVEASDGIIKNEPSDRKLNYVVVGDGEEKARLNALIRGKGLENKVFWVGRKENAASLLKAFDIFLLPSIKEGLPYVLLEAGMAKLPVIATDVGGIPEVIEDMRSGILVKSKRPDEIKKALEFLLEHQEKWLEFSDILSKKIASDFSLEKMLAETEKIYTGFM